jgi:exodeoxyribonuclease V gamma subunit
MVSGKSFRHDKLLPYWVAHLAGHLQGQPLVTVVLSKNGHAWLPPLEVKQAHEYWETLLEAWEQGMCSPLPFAVLPASAWLKGLEPKKRRSGPPLDPRESAWRAAESCFREQRERDLCVARCYPTFEDLWSGGAFETWTQALLQPLCTQLRTLGTTAAQGEAE